MIMEKSTSVKYLSIKFFKKSSIESKRFSDNMISQRFIFSIKAF